MGQHICRNTCPISCFYTGNQIDHNVLALKSSVILYDALPEVARNAGKSAVYMLPTAPE